MAWRIVERICVVLGLLFTAATLYYTAGAYYGWNQLPPNISPAGGAAMTAPWWLYAIGLLGIALLVTAWTMIAVRIRRGGVSKAAAPQKISTRLRLQFNGNGAFPLMVEEQNIWRWYSLADVHVIIRPETTPERRTVSWKLFITFDAPVAYKQITVSAGHSDIPTVEVKDWSPRHAVIVFGGDMPPSVVLIETIL